MEAGIDHHCAILDPVCLDEFRFAHGADNNVCLLHQSRQVLGAAVANGDGGIGFEQHHGHGFAQNRAAPHHDGMFAFQLHLIVLQQPHDALGGGATVGGFTHAHAAKPEAGDAVHVLFQADSIETGALVDLGGHRVLQQNAVHIRVAIQLVNLGQ